MSYALKSPLICQLFPDLRRFAPDLRVGCRPHGHHTRRNPPHARTLSKEPMKPDEPTWTPPAEEPGQPPAELRRIFRLFRPYRGRLAVVGLLVGASSLVSVASPSCFVRSWTPRSLKGARVC